jgi:hypothetical protein
MITFATVAYGIWQDHITFNVILTSVEKPTMMVTSTMLNTYDNSITIFVNSTTGIVETTKPTFPLIHINITNTGKTPIDKVTLNDVIPNDWILQEAFVYLINVDQSSIEIDKAYFIMDYDSENNLVMILFPIKKIMGETLDQNESLIVILRIQYTIIGQLMLLENETNPPTYTNTISTTVGIGNWQSQPATSVLVLATKMVKS